MPAEIESDFEALNDCEMQALGGGSYKDHPGSLGLIRSRPQMPAKTKGWAEWNASHPPRFLHLSVLRLILWDLNRSDADRDLLGHTYLGCE